VTWIQSAGLLVFFVLLYAALLLIFENKIIFHPSRYPEGFWEPASVGVVAQDIYFTAEDGVKLHGWFIPARNAVATLLWFHGNAGNLSHRLDNIQRLTPLNFLYLITEATDVVKANLMNRESIWILGRLIRRFLQWMEYPLMPCFFLGVP